MNFFLQKHQQTVAVLNRIQISKHSLLFDTPNDILLCYLHPLQPFSKEAETEAEAVAEALKKNLPGSGSGSGSKFHSFHISGCTKPTQHDTPSL